MQNTIDTANKNRDMGAPMLPLEKTPLRSPFRKRSHVGNLPDLKGRVIHKEGETAGVPSWCPSRVGELRRPQVRYPAQPVRKAAR